MAVQTSDLRAIVRNSKPVRATFIMGVVLLCGIKMFTYTDFLRPPFDTANDFVLDYLAAKEWLRGGDPYQPVAPILRRYLGSDDPALEIWPPEQRLPHPPALVVLYAPLTLLGLHAALVLWFALSLVATFLGILIFSLNRFSRGTAWLLAWCCLALPIVGDNMRWGPVNGVLLLTLAVADRWLQAGRETGPGILLGVATALKVFPILFLIPIARMGKKATLKWFLATAILVSLAGSSALGWRATIDYVTPASSENLALWSSAAHNIGAVSLVARWLSLPAETSSGPDDFVIGASAVMILVMCAFALTRTPRSQACYLFWSAAPWAILASPIAWPHYLLIMIPFGILVLKDLLRLPPARALLLGISSLVLVEATNALEWAREFGLRLNPAAAQALTSLVIVALASLCVVQFRGRGLKAETPSAV